MKSLQQRLTEFHADRQQPTVALKYKVMADNEFSFYRATCHLFYEDLCNTASLNLGPLVWICGDLHLENFGSYRASNGLVYFDVNDFDEAALAPASWDLSRFLCSIGMASSLWKYSLKEAQSLMTLALKAYGEQLTGAKAYSIEKETSPRLIQVFFDMAERKKERKMIKARIDKNKLRVIKNKTFALDKENYHEIKSGVNSFLKENYGFLKVRDVAFRIAGTGSLGVKRYVLLVEDKREDRWRLLDLKQSYPSSLIPYLTAPQPKWQSESDRIATIQSMMQYALPRFIGTLSINNDGYILKQLQPSAQKFDYRLCRGRMKNVETIMSTMARAAASAQLRSASRKGSASVEELVAFSTDSSWQPDLIQSILDYSVIMKEYFKEYRELYHTMGMKPGV